MLVIHSWWGCTSSFVDVADQLATAGLVAGCVDLFGGVLPQTPEEAQAQRRAHRREPVYRTLLRVLTALCRDEASDGSDPALVGFSMGGHWALWLAQRADVHARRVVVYYAARSVSHDGPAVPVLAHFADQDPYVSTSGRRRMESSLAKRGWPYRAHDYPGTSHWFAESADPHHDPVAARTAYDRTRAFLLGP